MCAKNAKIYPAHVSKYNSKREKQVILLMIWSLEICVAKSEGRQWHYLAVKELSVLLRGITSQYHGNFYCLNCPHSFATEKRLESQQKVCENKDFCNHNAFWRH